MKRIILSVIFSVLGVIMLVGGAGFTAFMHELHTVDFDKYDDAYTFLFGEDATAEEVERLRAERRITYPNFANEHINGYDPEYYMCYAEVDGACKDYALFIAKKYNNNADLDYTVDKLGDTLTIKFFGTGYPENGEPEALSRTYIYNVEGVGKNKLPKLMNRAEFIGY